MKLSNSLSSNALVLLLAMGSLTLLCLSLRASAQNDTSPDEISFTVFTKTGDVETRFLSEFRGKIVVLYFFSPW